MWAAEKWSWSGSCHSLTGENGWVDVICTVTEAWNSVPSWLLYKGLLSCEFLSMCANHMSHHSNHARMQGRYSGIPSDPRLCVCTWAGVQYVLFCCQLSQADRVQTGYEWQNLFCWQLETTAKLCMVCSVHLLTGRSRVFQLSRYLIRWEPQSVCLFFLPSTFLDCGSFSHT
jgi:hypothetical protein